MFDRMKSLDVAHTSLILQEVARLNASSILLQEELSEDIADRYEVLKMDFITAEDGARQFMGKMIIFRLYG